MDNPDNIDPYFSAVMLLQVISNGLLVALSSALVGIACHSFVQTSVCRCKHYKIHRDRTYSSHLESNLVLLHQCFSMTLTDIIKFLLWDIVQNLFEPEMITIKMGMDSTIGLYVYIQNSVVCNPITNRHLSHK